MKLDLLEVENKTFTDQLKHKIYLLETSMS